MVVDEQSDRERRQKTTLDTLGGDKGTDKTRNYQLIWSVHRTNSIIDRDIINKDQSLYETCKGLKIFYSNLFKTGKEGI